MKTALNSIVMMNMMLYILLFLHLMDKNKIHLAWSQRKELDPPASEILLFKEKSKST